ncbi:MULTISPECIES: paeninodin family lasso peptide [Paenibacillus]|nr:MULTISPECIES: paeninodin family lasso peptide [Paenibacillus]
MNMTKMEWQAPEMQVLDVNETAAGKGWKVIDWVTYDDADLYNPGS